MEEGEIEIINRNLDKLCKNTKCNSMLLAKSVALKILDLFEVSDIEALLPSEQPSKFYRIIQTRTNGFASLKKALLETNQTGALEILENGCAKTGDIGVIEDTGTLTYDLNCILGKGIHGTAVFKGKWAGRDVAVKSLPFDIVDKKQASSEVDILKTCDVHENIVRYFTSKQTATTTLIVLELCDMSLKEWVSMSTKSIKISPLEILRQVTVGLKWLHGQKIVHTDIKPENILLIGKPPRVKISSFGMSRRIVDGKSCVSTAELGWVAPEILAQILKQNSSECNFTFSSDIFALGCVYYFVLTDGKHPFGDRIRSQSNILDGKLMIHYEHVKHGCVQNVSFIKSMISQNPEKRPPCSALLSCPIFWDVNQGIKFLTDLNSYCDVNVKETLVAFKTETKCRLAHKPENEAMWTLFGSAEKNQGCIIPYAYLHFKKKLSEAIKEKDENEITPEENGVNSDATERNKRSKVRAQVDHWIKRLKQTLQGGKKDEKWKPPPNIEDNNNSLKIERLIVDLQEMTLDEKIGRLFRIMMTEDAETIKGIFEITNKTMKLRECWDAKLKSLLHIAVECREFSIVEFLVKNLGFSEMLSKPNMSDLIHTCLRGSESIALPIFQDKFEIIQLLVNINPTLIEKSDCNYQSPLHHALSKPSERQLEIILFLIQNKANVNAQDETGKTPLHYAVQQKPAPQMLVPIIELLMDNKADPDLVDGVGQSFLHCAASSHLTPALYHELVAYLAKVGREKSFYRGDMHGATVLHFAVYFLEPLNETLELFHKKGVDFKAVDERNNSVIFYAIKGGRNDTFLKELFRLGADWRIVNSNGDTALHCATLSGNLPALKLFISLGYDLDTTNLEWETPLHKALEGRNDFVFQIVKELVEHGAAKGLKNKKGKSPFDLAREFDKMGKGEQKIISLLGTV